MDEKYGKDLHRVCRPDKQGVAENGGKESADFATLCADRGTAVDDEHPDDDEVGDAGYCVPEKIVRLIHVSRNRSGERDVPSPLLAIVLVAKRSEETGQTHDHVCQNRDQDVGAAHASQQRQVKEYEGSGQGPVDVAGPVHLTDDGFECVWDSMPVVLTVNDEVEPEAHVESHGEIRKRRDDGDHRSDDMKDAFGLGIVSQIGSLGRAVLTSGTGQAMPMKAMEAMIMMTNTTLESSEHQPD